MSNVSLEDRSKFDKEFFINNLDVDIEEESSRCSRSCQKKILDKSLIRNVLYPISWKEPGIEFKGFKEIGFESTALVNFISLIGWNPGDEKEVFSLDELINQFSIERIIKGGAKYDYDKALWFNQEHIKKISTDKITVRALNESDITKEINVKKIDDLISLAKDRVNFQMEILNECKKIIGYDKKEIRSNSKEIKLTENILGIIEDFIKKLEQIDNINPNKLKEIYFDMLKNNDVKIGQGMKSLRVLLTGKTSGPDLFTLTEILGKDKIVIRLKKSMNIIND